MSYIVSIRRRSPITCDEVKNAVAGEPDFSLAEAEDGSTTLRWLGDADGMPEYLELEGGTIEITTPSDEALAAAQRLAAKLGAEVIGEEGEDLTDVQAPGRAAPGCGALLWALLLIAAIVGVYWLFN